MRGGRSSSGTSKYMTIRDAAAAGSRKSTKVNLVGFLIEFSLPRKSQGTGTSFSFFFFLFKIYSSQCPKNLFFLFLSPQTRRKKKKKTTLGEFMVHVVLMDNKR